MKKRYDAVIVGAGFAGAVTARRLAEEGFQVLVLEQREHIGGNAYDKLDENQIRVQLYGPHIYHTNEEEVHHFLSRFTEWLDYRHEVVANVHGREIPVPFNLNTLEMVYGKEKAACKEEKLIAAFGAGAKVPILKLRKHPDPHIQEIAQYVYENIFLRYTMKQWGQTPEEIDPAVTGRVPVVLSRDNRYFQDTWQGMPKHGFTALFEKMLSHENIHLRLCSKAETFLRLTEDGRMRIRTKTDGDLSEADFQNAWEPYEGILVYTGSIDELFDYQFGALPYRTLHFEWEHLNQESYQSHAVVNYTVEQDYTRITEFKKLYVSEPGEYQETGHTTIIREYPAAFVPDSKEIPYYAILKKENVSLYGKYQALAAHYPGLYLLGRLAEYRYYNMDAITKRALDLSQNLVQELTGKEAK